MKRVLLFGLILVFAAGCDFFENEEVEGSQVLYYVTASSLAGEVAIEYAEDGSIEQDTLTGLLWSRAFLAETASLELSAQNLADSGLVRAFIFIDDEEVAADSVTTDSLAATVQYEL